MYTQNQANEHHPEARSEHAVVKADGWLIYMLTCVRDQSATSLSSSIVEMPSIKELVRWATSSVLGSCWRIEADPWRAWAWRRAPGETDCGGFDPIRKLCHDAQEVLARRCKTKELSAVGCSSW